MSTYMKAGQPWLYDADTGDIVGVKDADGGESFFGRFATDVGGNTVIVDASGNVIIRPVVSYAWASRPAAASNTGVTIRITDIGGSAGSLWISDGTYWKPVGGRVVLGGTGVAASNAADTSELALASVTIPGYAMGTEGRIRVTSTWTVTSSANNKTLRVRLGGIAGTRFFETALTTSVSARYVTEFANRGQTNSQVGGTAQGNSSFGAVSAAVMTDTTDTTADKALVISGQKASAGETLKLESYMVELLVP